MQAKAFNPQAFLETLCYCVFGGIMFYLVSSKKYLSYVTPRMKPYLYFTTIVMLIWACAGLSRVLRPQHKIRFAHCFVLVIPILFLLLPHSPLNTADLSANYKGGNPWGQSAVNNTNKQDTSGGSSASNKTPTDSTVPFQQDANSSGSTNSAPDPATDALGLSGLDAANKTISVSNDEFYSWIVEIYTNLDKYEGYTITVTGFVFKDPKYKNEFVPARLAMTCCTADLTPLGMVCKYDKVAELKANSWVTVEGVLHKGQYQGQDEPQITVTKIKPAQEVEGYVYPY